MRPIDGDKAPKLFDKEYRETMKLIREGEDHLDNLAEGFSEAAKVIREMPTIEQYGTWIPCSERLPEESLNSVIGWDEYRKRCVFVQYWRGYWRFANMDDSVKIIAWMPLPKPYKGGDQNE